jgi:hypothetical protein
MVKAFQKLRDTGMIHAGIKIAVGAPLYTIGYMHINTPGLFRKSDHIDPALKKRLRRAQRPALLLKFGLSNYLNSNLIWLIDR